MRMPLGRKGLQKGAFLVNLCFNQKRLSITMAEKKEILDFIRREKENLLRKYYLTKIGLFGSFARDEQKAGSDIDLIVEFEPGTENLYEIKEEIRKVFQEQFHSEIDVCREKYIKPYYKEQILEDAIFI